jgi:hypothetical protein
MNRFDKLEYLLETCSSEFIKDCSFITELVSWMGESDFDKFYEKICSEWDIKTEEELQYN